MRLVKRLALTIIPLGMVIVMLSFTGITVARSTGHLNSSALLANNDHWQRVTYASAANRTSVKPSISDDARFVAFESTSDFFQHRFGST